MTTHSQISLELSVQQVNIILTALNEAPYRMSAPVIASIMEQVNAARMTSADPLAT